MLPRPVAVYTEPTVAGWVVRTTDGTYWYVLNAPRAWPLRSRYLGSVETLVPLSEAEAACKRVFAKWKERGLV